MLRTPLGFDNVPVTSKFVVVTEAGKVMPLLTVKFVAVTRPPTIKSFVPLKVTPVEMLRTELESVTEPLTSVRSLAVARPPTIKSFVPLKVTPVLTVITAAGLVTLPATERAPLSVVFPVTPRVPPTAVFPVMLAVPVTFRFSAPGAPPIPTLLPADPSWTAPPIAVSAALRVVLPATPSVPPMEMGFTPEKSILELAIPAAALMSAFTSDPSMTSDDPTVSLATERAKGAPVNFCRAKGPGRPES